MAEEGEARAQHHLAALYYEGRLDGGARRDLVAAYAWASRAAGPGNDRAPDLLAALEGEMPPDRLATARRLPAGCARG